MEPDEAGGRTPPAPTRRTAPAKALHTETRTVWLPDEWAVYIANGDDPESRDWPVALCDEELRRLRLEGFDTVTFTDDTKELQEYRGGVGTLRAYEALRIGGDDPVTRTVTLVRERTELPAGDVTREILASPNGRRTADAGARRVRGGAGPARESADDRPRIDGVTPRTAAVITAAVELSRRTLTHPAPRGMRLGSPREVADYLLPERGTHPVEKFGIASLNVKHTLVCTTVLSTGVIDASLVHPALVFRTAATHRAAASPSPTTTPRVRPAGA